MSEEKVPNELRYTKSHEWVKVDGNVATVGVTDHAQAALTDIVFVDLPTSGKTVAKGGSVLVLESVKTVADVYAPGAGSVTESNGELKAHPELVNHDPYGQGWLYRMQLTAPIPAGELMSADEYKAFVASGK